MNYLPLKTKLLLITIAPLIVVSALIASVNYYQSKALINSETQAIRERVLEEKRQEIRNYIHIARSAIMRLYLDEPGGRVAAQQEAKDVLNNLTFGQDGYFFVYTTDGTNLVHPKLTYLIGKNWIHLKDTKGTFVIQELIKAAEANGTFVEYIWHKPSAGKIERKISSAILFENWGWVVGTGLYLDDIDQAIEALRREVSRSIKATNIIILSITLVLIAIISVLLATLHLSEKRFADQKLKELNNRVFDVQEQERKRVATELHDSISQMLVSVRYGIELVQSSIKDPDKLMQYSRKCLATLDATLNEVRRISRDLRPSVLDDMGLSAALVTLGKEFEERAGLYVEVKAARLHAQLSDDAKTAVYRVVQEAMTNITKHANADHVWINLRIAKYEMRLTIEDDGKGLPSPIPSGGLGFSNMQERMETHGGSLKVSNRPAGGTQITVVLPLTTQTSAAAE